MSPDLYLYIQTSPEHCYYPQPATKERIVAIIIINSDNDINNNKNDDYNHDIIIMT